MKKLIKIKKQGQIIVNGGFFISESKNIVAIEIDLGSKYAEIDGIDDSINLMLGSSERTLYVKKSNEPTIISFPAHKKYSIFCSDISRYTLRVCLIKRKK